MADKQAEPFTKERKQIQEAMEGTSEGRYCAGWLMGLDRILYEEGGIWETLGRMYGWPVDVGPILTLQWMTWEEAATYYATKEKR